MKRVILQMIMGLAVALTSTGCISPSSVDEGTEAVLIYKPWIFGHGGVDPVPMKTGLGWTVWSTTVKRVNLKPFSIDESFDDLVTIDNNPVDFKIHLTFKNVEGKTPVLIEKFGENWYKHKVREPLRNSTRSFTKSNTMFAMTTDESVTNQLAVIVTEDIRKFLKDENIPTELVRATVGKVMPPKAVIEATIQTGVQKQNVKTQNERVKAENARIAAEVASATADRAYMKKMRMSPDQYLTMKQLENQRIAIDNGSQVTIIMGEATPMVSLRN